MLQPYYYIAASVKNDDNIILSSPRGSALENRHAARSIVSNDEN